MEVLRGHSAKEPKAMMHNSSMISTMNESRILTTANRKHRSNSKDTPATLRELGDTSFVMGALDAIDHLNESCPLWRQSSATWRYGSPRYSFSKDSRFKNPKGSHLDIQKL
jgi:hypothetical protein